MHSKVVSSVATAETASFERVKSGNIRADDHSLEDKIWAAREDERRRVAWELHDDLGQRLAVLSLAASEAVHNVPDDLPDLTRQLQSLQSEADRLISDLRRIALGVHSPKALSQGLQPALRELADDFRRSNHVKVRFRALRVPRHLNPSAAFQLYRIAQEALRNVAKHAGETPVDIRIHGTAASIRLEITDFGKGFDPVVKARRSSGLTIMRERASSISGTLNLSSTKGRGTRVIVEVPISIQTNLKEGDSGPYNGTHSR